MIQTLKPQRETKDYFERQRTSWTLGREFFSLEISYSLNQMVFLFHNHIINPLQKPQDKKSSPYKDLHFKATEYFSLQTNSKMKTHQNIQIRMPNLIVIPSFRLFILAFWIYPGEGTDSVLADSTTEPNYYNSMILLVIFMIRISGTGPKQTVPGKLCSFIQIPKSVMGNFKF